MYSYILCVCVCVCARAACLFARCVWRTVHPKFVASDGFSPALPHRNSSTSLRRSLPHSHNTKTKSQVTIAVARSLQAAQSECSLHKTTAEPPSTAECSLHKTSADN